jgi:hypothetical protein
MFQVTSVSSLLQVLFGPTIVAFPVFELTHARITLPL